MFRFVLALVLCLAGHAMRSGHEAAATESGEPDETDFVFVRKDSKRRKKKKEKLENPSIPEDCKATKFAGWMDNGTQFGSCGFTFLLPQTDCSNYYAQVKSMPLPGEFYQCHTVDGDCVVWAGQYSSKKACSSVKPEIQALLKAREECHKTLCDYARSGKWNGMKSKNRDVGVSSRWPEQTTNWGTWGWAKTAQKKCDPNPLVSAVFKHQVDIWQNSMTYKNPKDSQLYFDKTSCGCKSQDAC